MAQTVSLSANPRQATGKGAARQARFGGKVPAVIYGHGRDTQPLELEAKALEKALQGVEPASTIIELAVDGKTVKTLIREIQRHPIRPDIIHVDFYEIHASEKVKLKVPVHLVGNPDGVRNAGGVLDQVTREVEIEVLPANIPDRVELDVNALKIGDSLHVRDLTIPNAKILNDADLTIARWHVRRDRQVGVGEDLGVGDGQVANVQRVTDLERVHVELDAIRDVRRQHFDLHLARHLVEHAAGVAHAVGVSDEVHRHPELDLLRGVDFVEIDVDDVRPNGMALDFANQRLHGLAVHREVDDRARGLDPLQRLLEGLGLELERLGVAPVAIDHGRDSAAEAGLPRGALAGRLPRAR